MGIATTKTLEKRLWAIRNLKAGMSASEVRRNMKKELGYTMGIGDIYVLSRAIAANIETPEQYAVGVLRRKLLQMKLNGGTKSARRSNRESPAVKVEAPEGTHPALMRALYQLAVVMRGQSEVNFSGVRRNEKGELYVVLEQVTVHRTERMLEIA